MAEPATNQPEGQPHEAACEASQVEPANQKEPSSSELRKIVLTHYEDIYRYAFRLSGTQTDAEDLAQQTFLLAFRKLHQLRKADSLRPWLFAIARSCFLKGPNLRRPLTGQELAVDEIPDRAVGEDEIDREKLQAAISDLPEEFRVVVMMFYFEGLSYKEIAVQLDVAPGTVMSRLSRAKGRLRQRLLSKPSTGLPEGDPICCSVARGTAELKKGAVIGHE
jgi:RNA polymerase sigma-70 factor (ECF subfamily)